MSFLLQLLGRGLESDLSDVLDRYFLSPMATDSGESGVCCAEHSGHSDARFSLGVDKLRERQFEQAIEILAKVSDLSPNFAPARLALASALDEMGRTSETLQQLLAADEALSGEAPILFAAGLCMERLSRPDDAAEQYRQAVDRDGGFAAARERLAAVAVFQGNFEEAIEQYEAMRTIFPEQAWIRSVLGNLYYRNHQSSRAMEQCEIAIGMEPENWSMVDDEIEALVAAGHFRDAIEQLHILLERQGDFADLHCRLGDLYGRCGDDDEATRQYHLALNQQPDYLEARVKLGTHHLISGRWEQAADGFLDAVAINDASMANYVALGVAQLAAGRKTEGTNSFDLAMAVEPNSMLLLVEMMKLQIKATMADEMEQSFLAGETLTVTEISLDNEHLLRMQLHRHDEEIRRFPADAQTRYRYGMLLRATESLEESLEQFTMAAELCPTYAQALIELGITHREMGLSDKAVEAFRRAQDVPEQSVELHYRLGLLHLERTRFEEACRDIIAAGGQDDRQMRTAMGLSLQNMGLLDSRAATWRSLRRMHQASNA